MLQRIAVVLAHAKANKTVRLSISCAFCTSNTLVIMIYIYRREMQQVYIDR